MAPNNSDFVRTSGVLDEQDVETVDGGLMEPEKVIAKSRKFELVWRNIILMTLLHIQAVYGVYLLLFGNVMWKTIIFGKLQ